MHPCLSVHLSGHPVCHWSVCWLVPTSVSPSVSLSVSQSVTHFLGSCPDRGQSPGEWGDFTSVRTFVRTSIRTSPLLAGPKPIQPSLASQASGPTSQAQPGWPQAQPARPQAQPARPQALPARPQASGLAGWPRVGDRWTDGQMDVHT